MLEIRCIVLKIYIYVMLLMESDVKKVLLIHLDQH